ncbi:hypothetical protein BH18ACT9_BH18ACT9_15740 [soil metagenome]
MVSIASFVSLASIASIVGMVSIVSMVSFVSMDSGEPSLPPRSLAHLPRVPELRSSVHELVGAEALGSAIGRCSRRESSNVVSVCCT